MGFGTLFAFNVLSNASCNCAIVKILPSRKLISVAVTNSILAAISLANDLVDTSVDDEVYYRITDSTHISKITMKKLLSHQNTKKELTEYLAEKTLQHAAEGKSLVVAWGSQCKASHKDVMHLQSDQEEADTKMILHALDATANGATEVKIHSPDTDVFILALRRYPELCDNTKFVTGTGQRHREIHLKPIVQSLGQDKTAALPAFHALTGADITGSFAGRGKLTCWKVFREAHQDVVTALADLGINLHPSTETKAAIENLVCQFYAPNTCITKVRELRWFLFRKKQAQSERLPPTESALHEAILRAHFQAMVWNNDRVPNPDLPSPQQYGWRLEEDRWMPACDDKAATSS